MMTYAGQALTLPSQDYIPLLQRWWDESAPELWSHPGYSLEELHYLPVPDRPKPSRARLNTLYWPSEASRWGVFHGLISGTALTTIQSTTGGLVSTPVAADLVFTDAIQNQTITASMFLLAARPVFTLGTYQQYWMTLVDKRYYAWLKQLTYSFSPGDSWATLIGSLSTAAGLPSPTVSTISSDYGTPSSARWLDATGNPIQRPLPLLLDAACRSVGLRYVLSLQGTTSKALNYTDAAVIDLANYNNNSTAVYAGNRNETYNIIGNVPANVSVSFWSASSAPTIVNKTLSGLALSEYTGLTGVSGAYGFIGLDQQDTVVSPTQANAATQAATDYYLWLLSLNDVVFRSIRECASSGLEDRIEWEYVPVKMGTIEEVTGIPGIGFTQPGQITTRIVPLDWSDKSIYTFSPPSTGTTPFTPSAWIKVTDNTGAYSWRGRKVPGGTWQDTATTGTNDSYPVQIEVAGSFISFIAKPSVPGLLLPDELGNLAILPLQEANLNSGTLYCGYVSHSTQTWYGVKTFGERIIGISASGLPVTSGAGINGTDVAFDSSQTIYGGGAVFRSGPSAGGVQGRLSIIPEATTSGGSNYNGALLRFGSTGGTGLSLPYIDAYENDLGPSYMDIAAENLIIRVGSGQLYINNGGSIACLNATAHFLNLTDGHIYDTRFTQGLLTTYTDLGAYSGLTGTYP